MVVSFKSVWYISGRDDYKSQGYDTKDEAIYRLNEMINEPFYNCGLQVISRTIDMVRFSDGTIFKVVKS